MTDPTISNGSLVYTQQELDALTAMSLKVVTPLTDRSNGFSIGSHGF
jgi:hypothetical protein